MEEQHKTKTPKYRYYKTIGIDDVFVEAPSDPRLFPHSYLQAALPTPFYSLEIVGQLKCSPQDFVVREIAKKGRVIPGVSTDAEQKAFQVADLVDTKPPPRDEHKTQDKQEEAKGVVTLQNPSEKQDEKDATKELDTLLDTEPLQVLKQVLADATEPNELAAEKWMESLRSLQAASLERIKTILETKEETPIEKVFLPSDLDKGRFHKAIRFAFPLLQSNSGPQHPIEVSVEDFFDDLIPFLSHAQEDLPKLYKFQKRGCLAATIRHPERQAQNRNHNHNKRKREPDPPPGAMDEPVLRLKPDMDKDVRRSIHHLLAAKNKAFQTQLLKKPAAILVFWNSGAQHRARKKFEQVGRKREGEGGLPHTLCVLKKTEWEHLTAIKHLCAAVKCRTADVGLAGIKDMKAVTFQYCTLRNIGPFRILKAIPDLKRKGIEIGSIQKVDFTLQSGDLEGNRFEITLRKVQRVHVESSSIETFVPCEKQHLMDAFERLQRSGFVNFFGEQRVGAPGETADVGVRTFDIGRAMLQGNFDKAIDLIMSGRTFRNSRENPQETNVRKAWKESGGDAEATLKSFPRGENMTRERALMKGLNRYGKNEPRAAIQCLPHNVRRFWINSYQSFVWNTMASARLKRCGFSPVLGDLYIDGTGIGKYDVKVVNADTLSSVTLEQLVLPLPGFGVQYPENEIGSLYAKMLKEEGVGFERQGDDESTAKGAYRNLIVNADNMHLNLDGQESESCSSAMTIGFDLPSGSYATMLLREFMFTTVARD